MNRIKTRTPFGEMFRLYRTIHQLSLRDCAKELHISSATLMRIEHGEAMDATTMLTLMNWLFCPQARKGA